MLAVPDAVPRGRASAWARAGCSTVFRVVVLPSAMLRASWPASSWPSGRIVGETAALIYTAGTVAQIPGSIFDSAQHAGACTCIRSRREGLHTERGLRHRRRLLLVVVLHHQRPVRQLIARQMDEGEVSTSMDNKFTDRQDMNLYYGDFRALKDVTMRIPARTRSPRSSGRRAAANRRSSRRLNRMNDLVEGCKITGDVRLDGAGHLCEATWMSACCASRVGMVFQKPNPFPMSIYDNIAYGPRTHGITKTRCSWTRSSKRSLQERRHLGRAQGPAQKERARPFRRPAAAAVHRPRAGRASGGAC